MRGGKRDGAGRPPAGEEAMERVTIRLAPAEIERAKERGGLTAYLRGLIRRDMEDEGKS